MGNPDLAHLPTAEEYALFREAYAETYPVRPLMNAIDAKDAEIRRLTHERNEARAELNSTNGHWPEIQRLRAALRAARPCVFNSRYGSWEKVLRLVDEALREESRDG